MSQQDPLAHDSYVRFMEEATSLKNIKSRESSDDVVGEPAREESVVQERFLQPRSREVHIDEYLKIARSLGIGGMPSDSLPANKQLLIKVTHIND